MPLNTSRSAIVADRRRKVAAFRLRQYSQREIVQALADEGEDWSLGTINGDLKALEKEWRQEALGDVDDLRGVHLAEIREARGLAWKSGKLFYIFEGLKQEADLLALAQERGVDPSAFAELYLDLYSKAVEDAADQSVK